MSRFESPFLAVPERDWLCSNDLAFAIFDGFPVSPGHLLVTTRRLVETWFDATDAEQAALMDLVKESKDLLDQRLDPKPDGYNVGFNSGGAAGQTVPHVHVHVIPRYHGDMTDPRGGVRHVIPDKGRVLLIAHRAEILIQAEATVRAAMQSEWEETRVTWYLGANRDMGGDLVVASVQKLTRPEGLAALESQRFIFLQQLGRGLRAAENKLRLKVIDFVGNHRVFASRLTHLLSLGNRSATWTDLKQFLFQTTPQNITLHLKSLYEDGEIDESATCKDYLQVRVEGSREVRRTIGRPSSTSSSVSTTARSWRMRAMFPRGPPISTPKRNTRPSPLVDGRCLRLRVPARTSKPSKTPPGNTLPPTPHEPTNPRKLPLGCGDLPARAHRCR